jgi:hypothetical protein
MAAQLGESIAFGGSDDDWHNRGAGGGVAGGLTPMEPDQCGLSHELVVAREAAKARRNLLAGHASLLEELAVGTA